MFNIIKTAVGIVKGVAGVVREAWRAYRDWRRQSFLLDEPMSDAWLGTTWADRSKRGEL